MKKTLFLFLLFSLITGTIMAQVPQKFKYQAVLRDNAGEILTSHAVEIGVSILQGTETGTEIFSETHNVSTDTRGLIVLQIGSLLNGTGTIADIDWSVDDYFVEISVDGTVMGVSQLLGVPYALHAKTANTANTFDYINLTNAPDFSDFDQDVSNDFDWEYSSLLNAPTTITPEQSSKIDFLTVTEVTDLDQMRSDVAANNEKISFPGFGITAGTALEANSAIWTHNAGNLYHLGNVGVNVTEPSDFSGSTLHVGGGILFEGDPSATKSGMLFYNSDGEGSFRYYNENNEVKVLGEGTITYSTTATTNNLIIDGSLAVGFDAVNGEEFGYNTMILKENNLRILFDDTDDPASGFPDNDWQLVANDSQNGGDNYFSIVDITAGTTPFKVMAGAGDNALYISETGNVGIGTNNPGAKLEVAGTIKAGSFIGDGSGLTGITGATGGVENADNTLIAADTDNNNTGEIVFQTQQSTKMIITNDGKVGIGTSTPSVELEVIGTDKFTELQYSGNLALDNYQYQITNDNTDAVTTLDYDVTDKSVVTFNSVSGIVTISGFQAGIEGQEITIINTNDANSVVIKHNGAGTQKILLPGSADLTLGTYSSARFNFDGTSWYCVGVQ